MRARMARSGGVDPWHESFDLGGRLTRRRQLRDRRQRRGKYGLSFHRADAPQSHRCRNKSSSRRISGHRGRGCLAEATGAPDKTLHDGQVAERFATFDARAQFPAPGVLNRT